MSAKITRERDIKACRPCAKAKVKCELVLGDGVCKRCQRLGRECIKQNPGAHSHKGLPDWRHSRADILRLEAKFDSMSQYLSSQPQATLPSPLQDPIHNCPNCSPIDQSMLPAGEEAMSFLRLFRVEMMSLFPFVTIPLDISPAELNKENHILYMSVMMVACQSDVKRQLNLARAIREEISQVVFVRGENRLDLLEGLLVFAAWHHTHVDLNFQLSSLIHQAIGLATDLELHKEPYTKSKTAPGGLRSFDRDRASEVTRTLRERRAYLAVFWLSSIAKTCVKDMESPKFTRYAESCCRILEECMEHITDAYLVQLVRMQQIAERIGDMLYSDDINAVSSIPAPLAMTISSLEKEVVGMEAMLTPNIYQSSLLTLSLNSLKIHLYKIGLDETLFTSSPFSPNTHPFLRTSLLDSCLNATTTLLTTFLALPAHNIFSLPYPFWAQMGYALLILSRLFDITDDAPPSGILDFRGTLKALANKLEDVMMFGMSENPVRQLPEIFKKMVWRLMEIRERVGGRESEGYGGDTGAEARTSPFEMLEDEHMSTMLFEFLDKGMWFQ